MRSGCKREARGCKLTPNEKHDTADHAGLTQDFKLLIWSGILKRCTAGASPAEDALAITNGANTTGPRTWRASVLQETYNKVDTAVKVTLVARSHAFSAIIAFGNIQW